MGSPYGRRTHDEADRILGLCSRSRHGKPDGGGGPARGCPARRRRIIVTGSGTSYHAATYGARVLQSSLGARPAVHAIHAYDLLRDPAAAGDTVLAVSHSGNTPT